jgi:DNA polymerase
VLRTPDGVPVLGTIHPSALLRTLGQPDAELNQARFIDDLKKISEFVE